MPDLDEGDADPDAPQDVGADGEIFDPDAEPDVMGLDEFRTVFRMVFDLPQYFVPELEVLAIQPKEETQLRAVEESAYKLLLIWAPQILVKQGETAAHLMVVVPFLVMKGMVVYSVIKAKRQPPRPIQPQRPANENAQPQPQPQQETGHPETGDWKLPGQAA
jgi:hypothetical protein